MGWVAGQPQPAEGTRINGKLTVNSAMGARMHRFCANGGQVMQALVSVRFLAQLAWRQAAARG
jgi:hypothetical protein